MSRILAEQLAPARLVSPLLVGGVLAELQPAVVRLVARQFAMTRLLPFAMAAGAPGVDFEVPDSPVGLPYLEIAGAPLFTVTADDDVFQVDFAAALAEAEVLSGLAVRVNGVAVAGWGTAVGTGGVTAISETEAELAFRSLLADNEPYRKHHLVVIGHTSENRQIAVPIRVRVAS